MDYLAWITLGLGLLGLSATIIMTAIKLTWWLGAKLDEITSNQTATLAAHEIKDQQRHEENIERFVALETVLINGHRKRRRA